MATRVALSLITQSEATDEGKLLVKGSGRRGDMEVELPGEAATMLIAGIVAFPAEAREGFRERDKSVVSDGELGIEGND
jgi:hypothetical protein